MDVLNWVGSESFHEPDGFALVLSLGLYQIGDASTGESSFRDLFPLEVLSLTVHVSIVRPLCFLKLCVTELDAFSVLVEVFPLLTKLLFLSHGSCSQVGVLDFDQLQLLFILRFLGVL